LADWFLKPNNCFSFPFNKARDGPMGAVLFILQIPSLIDLSSASFMPIFY
jgi:hypothetical protein